MLRKYSQLFIFSKLKVFYCPALTPRWRYCLKAVDLASLGFVLQFSRLLTLFFILSEVSKQYFYKKKTNKKPNIKF